MENLTPRQIVAELDKYVIGQPEAKRAVAVAVRNRWRRQQLPAELREEVAPKNIIMIGPTGVGKTEIARRLAGLTGAPFVKVEATKYTEVGYVGRDVESMVRDLVELAIGMEKADRAAEVQSQAEANVEARLLDALLPVAPALSEEDPESVERRRRTREKLVSQLRIGALDDRSIEIDVQIKALPIAALGPLGFEQMGPDFQNVFEKLIPTRQQSKRVTVSEARQVFLAEEIDKLVDDSKAAEAAIQRVQTFGIIFIDEIDKICGPHSAQGPDVSRQGVQRDLLPIVEGSTVATRHGMVRTDHILFIAAGAFHMSKPSDLMPELQGRFPIRVELKSLTKDDFIRILTEPHNSLVRQTVALLGAEGVDVRFTPDGVEEIAAVADEVNAEMLNIGARRLYTVMEKVTEQLSFEAPDLKDKRVVIDAGYVRSRIADIVENTDLSKFIL